MQTGNQNIARILDVAHAADIRLDDVARWPHEAASVLACSNFVADSFAANPALLQDLLGSRELLDGDEDAQAISDRVVRAVDGAQNKDELAARLRRIRRREFVRIAWRGLGGAADLKQTMRDLSVLAMLQLRGSGRTMSRHLT